MCIRCALFVSFHKLYSSQTPRLSQAKGLEFDSVALIGFFSYIEDRCSGDEWRNALLWLSSTSSLAVTESTEVVSGVRLRDCDYTLHSPQVSDEAMMLYTALTRAKDRSECSMLQVCYCSIKSVFSNMKLFV